MAYSFRVTAKANINGRIGKGMSVQVFEQNSTFPGRKNIQEAFENQLGVVIDLSNVGLSNFDVEIEDLLIIEIDKLQIKTILSNFRFNGKTLKFIKKNSDTVNLLSFSSCEFLCAIHFDNCSLFELTFISNKFNSNLFLLNNCKINNFKLNEENVFEEGNFEIYYSEFESNFEIENVKFIDFNSLKIENFEIEKVVLEGGSENEDIKSVNINLITCLFRNLLKIIFEIEINSKEV